MTDHIEDPARGARPVVVLVVGPARVTAAVVVAGKGAPADVCWPGGST